MTTEELEAIKARADKATPGPWECWAGGTFVSNYDGPQTVVCDVLLDAEMRGKLPRGHSEVNGQFIAHARADIPALVAEVERLRESIRQAVDDLSYLYCTKNGMGDVLPVSKQLVDALSGKDGVS